MGAKEKLERLNYIDSILSNFVSKMVDSALEKSTKEETKYKYSSIKEYTRITGKRFRTSPDQKRRGLSREEAFKEFSKKSWKTILDILSFILFLYLMIY